MLFLVFLSAQIPFLVVAAWWLNRERLSWKCRWEALDLEARTFYQGHVDADFKRHTGSPLYGPKSEPQEAGFSLEMGADRVERERLLALRDIPNPDDDPFIPEDYEYLAQLNAQKAEEVN